MSLLVVGSIALDSLKTPFGERENILGGSAVHFSLSASFFAKVRLVGVVGADFPQRYIRLLRAKGIDLRGLEVAEGETFRWKGSYGRDLNHAHTIYTKLNVFQEFSPKIPEACRKAPYLFLANIDPNLQLSVLKKMRSPKLVACDSMNFWIEHQLKPLKRLLKKIDIFIINETEAKLLSGEGNLLNAARYVLSLGPEKVIIKRGDSGAALFTKKGGIFCASAYLTKMVRDPTGAGDSFAGGFMGYLTKNNTLNEAAFRKAVIYGTIMASFCVQDFGPNRLLRLRPSDINKRFAEYKKLNRF